MTAIVNDDIRWPKLSHDRGQKLNVVLAADADADLILLALFAARINVEANDAGEWSKIAFPKLQRPTLSDANFEERNVPVAEPFKMLLVDRKILIPLMHRPMIAVQISIE